MATTPTAIPIETILAYRQKLINALMSTASVIEFEDRRIERRSTDEILASLSWLDSQLGGMVGGSPTFPRVRVTTTHKDL
jgi:hypothetical protein